MKPKLGKKHGKTFRRGKGGLAKMNGDQEKTRGNSSRERSTGNVECRPHASEKEGRRGERGKVWL